jgi:eukaryotic-like serine/threonine-protein kinase
MINQTVSHYRVLRKVGRGGMGVVYEALDQQLNRKVAIKFLASAAAPDDHAVLRLRREARAASALNHPNICTVHDLGEHEGRPYIVFELLEGATVGALQAGRPLPPETILDLGAQIASALECAHQAGIVHRDIKPSNLFVNKQHQLKVLDFGLAKPGHRKPSGSARDDEATASRAADPITQEGVAVGTAPYMSPEQALGEDVDHRTDIFSLGAVLHEMATGKPAFGGPTQMAVHDAVLHRVPPPPSSLNPAIPPALDAIIAKALEKDRDFRYQSAGEIRIDLQRLRRDATSGQGSSATRPVPIARPAWWRRVRWMPIAVVALAVLVVVVSWLALRWRDAQDPFVSAVARQLTSAPGWESDPAISPDGNWVAYASNEGVHTNIWVVHATGGHATQLTHDAAPDREPAWLPDNSGILFSSERDGRRGIWQVPWPSGPPFLKVQDAAEPAVSPDGTRLAFAREDPESGESRIVVAPLSDVGRATALTTAADGRWGHHHPSWSPNGGTIAYRAQNSIWTVPASGGKASQLIGDGFRYHHPVWSADGHSIYVSSDREGAFAIWRLPIEGGRPVRVTVGTGPERYPSVSPDGRRLAYSTLVDNPDLIWHELATGREVTYGGDRMEHMGVFSADGRTVFFVSNRQADRDELWAVPFADGQATGPARRVTDHPGNVSHPSLSPDGRWVAYYRIIGDRRNIWIVPAAGGAPAQFTSGSDADVHPDWSPDGRRIAYVSDRGGSPHIWVAPVSEGRPAGPPRQVTSGPQVPEAPVWSPGGDWVVYVGDPRANGGDVWRIRADGRGAPIRVTTDARAIRVCWHPVTKHLLVAGWWDASSLRVRDVDPDTGAWKELEPPVTIAEAEYRPDFDITRDGRWLMFSRDTLRGDIWILDRSQAGR